MTLGMTLVYPVQWGVAIRGAHGSYRVRLPDAVSYTHLTLPTILLV